MPGKPILPLSQKSCSPQQQIFLHQLKNSSRAKTTLNTIHQKPQNSALPDSQMNEEKDDTVLRHQAQTDYLQFILGKHTDSYFHPTRKKGGGAVRGKEEDHPMIIINEFLSEQTSLHIIPKTEQRDFCFNPFSNFLTQT